MNPALIANLVVFLALVFLAAVVIIGGGARIHPRREIAKGPSGPPLLQENWRPWADSNCRHAV